MLVLGLVLPTAASGAPTCSTSGPPSGAYTVTVCIQTPEAGSALSGDVAVRATATVSGSTAKPRRMTFRLAGSALLTDFFSPFEFTLPSARWGDGIRTLTATANLTNNFTSKATSASLTFANGIAQAEPVPATFSPRTGTAVQPGAPFVVAAVGDGADGGPRSAQVAGLVGSWDPNMFLYLGDVYEHGTYTEMRNHYGTTPGSLGELHAITNPAVGNHEYGAGPGAPGYFDYWGQPGHRYSVDANGWHLIALDTTETYGQRQPGTEQVTWLEQDLAASGPCTLAFGHHPRFSVGGHPDDPGMDPIWSRLVGGGADMYLAGHAHNYQRWNPLDASGALDPAGMTQLVAGTGGHNPVAFSRTDDRLARGFDRFPQAAGAIRLELNAQGAAFAYYQSNGSLLDWGSIPCRESPPDVTPPTPPDGLIASPSADRVDLQWEPSLDNVGVTGYRILRDDEPIATIGPVTTYRDASVTPGASYRYEVVALDASGGSSLPSLPAEAMVPTTVFADDFETGNIDRWTSSSAMVVQQAEVDQGLWAARATTSGGAGPVARKTLSVSRNELIYRARFKVIRRSTAAG
ncbi:MAG: metallophosphoesterase, partial [Actinomycetota bacterium]|nr:metallophosphoesterase [Actinomycetota bacterium]